VGALCGAKQRLSIKELSLKSVLNIEIEKRFTMKKINKSIIAGYASSLLLLLGASFSIQAVEQEKIELDHLQTFDGQSIILEKGKLTHLIFQEIWRSYNGQGEEALVAALPKAFIDRSQKVWVQPGINVTDAQLIEFQGYFPQVAPLVLDNGFSLLRSIGDWDLPLHVILKDGKKLFSGNGDELKALSDKYFSSSDTISNWFNSNAKVNEKIMVREEKNKPVKFITAEAAKLRYHKPEEGDKAPLFTAETMAGNTISLMGLAYNKPVSLVFVDSLCPMPQFPDCETKLATLNNLVANDASREWIGVVSSYYVSDEIAQQFRDKFQLKMPLIFDTDNQIYQSYGVHASPYQIDINRDGTIRSRGANIH
jgi:peroxiredoxin